ncbi:MAG: ATP-binding protein [Sandaracinaceae bacterium]
MRRSRPSRLSRFSSTLTDRLRASESIDELCTMMGELVHEMLPDDIIVVSLREPTSDTITIRSHHGLGAMVERVFGAFGSDPRGMVFSTGDMTLEERRRYCSGHLERVPGGIYELVTRRAPERICQGVERMLGVTECQAVGFGQDEIPQGGLAILCRAPIPSEDRPLIELIAGMVSLAIRQRRTDHERLDLQRRLQQTQKLEAIGQLAGGVAHDYNNTLQVIRSIAETMQSELPAEHPQQGPLSELLRAADHARDVTKTLLAIGRRQHLKTAPLDLNDLVQDTVRWLRSTLRDEVVVDCRTPSQPVVVSADERELQRALINLAVNAQDAMPEGGTLRFHVRAESPDAVLEVIDSGLGMPPHVQRQAFEPFFTTKGEEGGTGLGLASVYGVVEQHGGSISLDSAPGRGARFVITLPLTEAEVAPVAPARERSALLAPREGWVLVTDDERLVRRAVSQLLRRMGLEVVEAASGAEALERCDAASTPPCLVLTDLSMPGMSGLELLRQLAERYPGVPRVAMSGYLDAHLQEIEPALSFLPKPFSAADIEDLLARLLPS